MVMTFEHAVQAIIKAGNRLDQLQLAPATSGNYSIRIGNGEMAITVSGAHKGQLSSDQIMRCALDGTSLDDKKPSAETLLHSAIYKLFPEINAILHTHSVANTVLTRVLAEADALELKGYEMLKVYPSIDTHDTVVSLPIVDNTQDIVQLSGDLEGVLTSDIPVFMIRSHGIYGWGRSMDEASHIIEATEMMLACEMHEQQIRNYIRT